MTDTISASEAIQKAVEEMGLPAFAELANVPYTTARHWKQKGWARPDAFDTYERLVAAAEAHAASKGASQ